MFKHNFLVATTFFTCMTLSACKTESIIPPFVPTIQHDIEIYVTTANKSMLFANIPLSFSTKPNMSVETTITMKPSETYQEIDGFGAAITGSTCYNLLKMSAENRTKLLKETFDPITGMGYSYIRISIGCSDFSMDEYTYCDTPGIENFARVRSAFHCPYARNAVYGKDSLGFSDDPADRLDRVSRARRSF